MNPSPACDDRRSLPFNPVCYVSDVQRFIWILIAKNASSTLRTELSSEPYDAEQTRLANVDLEKRRSFFTFAFLLDGGSGIDWLRAGDLFCRAGEI